MAIRHPNLSVKQPYGTYYNVLISKTCPFVLIDNHENIVLEYLAIKYMSKQIWSNNI